MGNTGQTLIAIGLLVVITVLVINANRMVTEGNQERYEGIARLEAADLARDLLSEALSKKFDRSAVTTRFQSTSEFTAYTALGPDVGEPTFGSIPDTSAYASFARYDDFDDYNNYQRTANTAQLSGYRLTSRVFYATQTAPDRVNTGKTYLKTMEVSVSHSVFLKTAIKFSTMKVY